MPTLASAPTRTLTILAQDPNLLADGRILTAEVDVPAEPLAPGPRGHRVQIVDFDASSGVHYRPREHGLDLDPYADARTDAFVRKPDFHAQNVYAIVMRTLARFEQALGRRIGWSFGGHQIQIAPHAFADANAFYSKRDHAIFFGYFPSSSKPGETVFSCLSHDVVAHETTHALLDGLRERFTDPSSPDQAAFHEGFADVVALLSVFSLRGIVEYLIDHLPGQGRKGPRIQARYLDREKLKDSILFHLAEEMGQEIAAIRGQPLRNSIGLPRSKKHFERSEFQEPHRRGEILVAAMLNAFLEVWVARLRGLGELPGGGFDRARVVEEGRDIADALLSMSIRALDYCPPADLEFCDYLSALLTADARIRPDDTRYRFRERLLESFRAYGIEPAEDADEQGLWQAAPRELQYDRTHFEALQRDPDEVFRFLWENRGELELETEGYTKVLSVRPCTRVGPDGFVLRETVAEYHQILELSASELRVRKFQVPPAMPADQPVTLYGGGALVFDEYGRLRYHVTNRLQDKEAQSRRLAWLWEYGAFSHQAEARRRFSSIHRVRALGGATRFAHEVWS